MSDPKPTTEQLIATLQTQQMREPVYSQVGSGDGRTTAELMEHLAKESGTWTEEMSEVGHSGGWGDTLVAGAAQGGR